MSYDPYSSYPAEPRPGEPYDDHFQRPLSDVAQIKARVTPPAISLIAVSIINLLVALVQVGGTVLALFQSPQDIQKNQKVFINMFPAEMREEMEKEQQGKSPESEKVQSLIVNGLLSALMLAVALLTLLGGIRMLTLKSYALCMAGAICAAIPCISCGGCCGFGEGIGIWAIVVLLKPEVKAAFQ